MREGVCSLADFLIRRYLSIYQIMHSFIWQPNHKGLLQYTIIGVNEGVVLIVAAAVDEV